MVTSLEDLPELFSVKTFAEEITVQGLRQAYRTVKENQLSVEMGGSIRVSRRAVKKWIEEETQRNLFD